MSKVPKVKFELASWSDAELRIHASQDVMGNLEETLYRDGNKAAAGVAHAAYLLLEDALSALDCGMYR